MLSLKKHSHKHKTHRLLFLGNNNKNIPFHYDSYHSLSLFLHLNSVSVFYGSSFSTRFIPRLVPTSFLHPSYLFLTWFYDRRLSFMRDFILFFHLPRITFSCFFR